MDSKKQAQGIASLGRYGDTTLMHMRPDEVEQLTAISRANGGDVTINPKTGMPEAFLGDFVGALLPTAAGIGAGALFGPAGGAIAGGLTSFMQGKRDPLSIGLGALGGYGGANIAAELGKVGATVPATAAAETGSNIAASGTTTAASNAAMNTTGFNPALTTAGGQGIPVGSNFGSQALTTAGGRGVGLGPVNTVGGPTNISGVAGSAPRTPIQTYASTQNLSPYTNQTTALQNQQQFGAMTENAPLGEYPNYQPIKPDAGQAYQFQAQADRSPLQEGFEYSQSKFNELGRGTKAVFTDADKRSQFFKGMGGAEYDTAGNLIKEGSEGMGMLKTALPIAGAGAEAYMKGAYEGMPTYEQSTAGLYDPTRRLNLSMDTGLRLLAQGGKVEKFAEGNVVRDRSYYGIKPEVQTINPTGGPLALQGPQTVRAPVKGFIDVGGKFVASPKGDITDVEYENRFKYVTEGVAKPEDSGGDMAGLNAEAAGGAGINPALALQAAQGYAKQQTSSPNEEQGLGTLAKGGSVRRFQMGGTTAEENKQNIQSMYGEPGKTTAEQNLSRDAIQEAGTVVTQQMDNDLAKRAGETFSKLPVVPGDANNNMAKILGVALKSSPESFTVVPNAPTTPQGLTALNLNTGRQEQKGMAEGGIAGLTPDDGKMLNGNGDGVSDEIPAMIEGEQEAALSDGEFIVPARIVSELGNGSSDAGAQKLYAMIDRIQAARSKTMGDNKEYAKDTNAERYLPA